MLPSQGNLHPGQAQPSGAFFRLPPSLLPQPLDTLGDTHSCIMAILDGLTPTRMSVPKASCSPMCPSPYNGAQHTYLAEPNRGAIAGCHWPQLPTLGPTMCQPCLHCLTESVGCPAMEVPSSLPSCRGPTGSETLRDVPEAPCSRSKWLSGSQRPVSLIPRPGPPLCSQVLEGTHNSSHMHGSHDVSRPVAQTSGPTTQHKNSPFYSQTRPPAQGGGTEGQDSETSNKNSNSNAPGSQPF